jgi:dUTP pyrophosphatase
MRLCYANFEDKRGIPPSKEHGYDAGWDLFSLEKRTLMPGERHLFGTGLILWFEPLVHQLELFDNLGFSWYGRLADKSGLANKHGVHILGGVVDRGYSGEVKIVLANLGFLRDGRPADAPWTVAPGEPLCQIVPEVILDARRAEYREIIPPSDRGDRGFTSG